MKQRVNQRSQSKLKILHPIESLGLAAVPRGAVRVETLAARQNPRVPFPHKHDFYQLVFVSSGKGWHEVDFQRFAIAPGKLFLLKPGQIHAWALSKDTDGFVVEFTPEAVARDFLFAWLKNSPSTVTAGKNFWKDILPLLNAMLTEFSHRPPHFEISLQAQVKLLLLALLREFGSSGSEKIPNEIERFQELVEEFYIKEHGVEFYAKKLGLTPKVLTMRVSRSLQRSARAVIQARILLEAKRLLAQSDDPVAEIGYSLGFDDPNYFARFFRANGKISPGEFRGSTRP